MKHATVYDKVTGSHCSKKMKQLEAVLMSQQRFFTRTCESNENATKASYNVTTVTTKYCKPFAKGEFIKYCIKKMVDNICYGKKQELTNVCLAHYTVAWRNKDIFSDIKRHLVARGVNFDFFFINLQ